MKKLVGGILAGVVAIGFSVAALPLIFIAASTPAYACSSPDDPSGQVSLGSGPASEAYFNLPYLGRVEERKSNAKKIIEIGRQRKESDYSIQTALETSLQESGLLNLTGGDKDSLGLFQQRPSQGWGTRDEILNIQHATDAFFNALDKVPNKDSLTHKAAALIVQNPSIEAYGTWHWDDIGNDLMKGASSQTCGEAAGAHLPLDPGYGVSDGFNDPRDNESIGSHPHVGIDLVYGSNTRGRPVYAAFSGTVIDSGYGQGCSGNNPVEIVSSDGLTAWYLHMNGADILVKKGDTVKAGQKIGAIGACGQVTGPHLHFAFSPGNDHDAWIGSVETVQKFGVTWLDPVAVMAHYGVKLLQ